MGIDLGGGIKTDASSNGVSAVNFRNNNDDTEKSVKKDFLAITIPSHMIGIDQSHAGVSLDTSV